MQACRKLTLLPIAPSVIPPALIARMEALLLREQKLSDNTSRIRPVESSDTLEGEARVSDHPYEKRFQMVSKRRR
jgi:hypothetical protein